MLIDAELVLEAAMDISATAEAAVTKDTGAPHVNPDSQGPSGGASEGHKTYARFLITTAASAGSVIFHASESTDDSTFTKSKSSRSYAFGELPAGTIVKVEVPPDTARYIGAGVTAITFTGGVAHVDFFHG